MGKQVARPKAAHSFSSLWNKLLFCDVIPWHRRLIMYAQIGYFDAGSEKKLNFEHGPVRVHQFVYFITSQCPKNSRVIFSSPFALQVQKNIIKHIAHSVKSTHTWVWNICFFFIDVPYSYVCHVNIFLYLPRQLSTKAPNPYLISSLIIGNPCPSQLTVDPRTDNRDEAVWVDASAPGGGSRHRSGQQTWKGEVQGAGLLHAR